MDLVESIAICHPAIQFGQIGKKKEREKKKRGQQLTISPHHLGKSKGGGTDKEKGKDKMCVRGGRTLFALPQPPPKNRKGKKKGKRGKRKTKEARPPDLLLPQ